MLKILEMVISSESTADQGAGTDFVRVVCTDK